MYKNKKNAGKCFLCTFVFALLSLTGCFSDNDESGDSSAPDVVQAELPFIVCANRNPGGVGVDLDSGEAYNIDDNPDFDWDFRIKAFKGVQGTDGEPALAGAPFIKLKGTAVMAAVWQGAGEAEYSSILLADVTGLELSPDGYEEIDLSAVDVVQEGEFTQAQLESGNCAVGNYYYAWSGKNGLKQEYAKCAVGESWKSTSSNTDHTDDIIYIIKSDSGSFFKVKVPNFGPKSDLGESGYCELVWEKLQ